MVAKCEYTPTFPYKSNQATHSRRKTLINLKWPNEKIKPKGDIMNNIKKLLNVENETDAKKKIRHLQEIEKLCFSLLKVVDSRFTKAMWLAVMRSITSRQKALVNCRYDKCIKITLVLCKYKYFHKWRRNQIQQLITPKATFNPEACKLCPFPIIDQNACDKFALRHSERSEESTKKQQNQKGDQL